MKKLIGILAALFILSSFAYADAASVGIIGGADGPTAIYTTEDSFEIYEDYYYDEYYDDEYFDEYYEDEYCDDDYYYDPECVWIMLNGNYVWFDFEEACEIDGSIFVPMRDMFEEFGAEVLWDNATKTAKGVLGDTTVEFIVGSTDYKVNGEVKTLSVAPCFKGSCTMIPVRALSESLGAEVYWNNETKEVEISFLRPLSSDEQYLYDVMTNKDIPACEQTASMKLLITDDDVDVNLNMDIKTVGDAKFSYSNIIIKGDIYRKLISINADIKLWALADGEDIKIYSSLNGSEASPDMMGFYENLISNMGMYSYADFEKNAVYNMFNRLKINSVESKNGQKIIAFEYSPDEYTPAMKFTYYINEKTEHPVKMVMDMASFYDDFFDGEDVIYSIPPIEVNIKYNVKMPQIPGFLK